MNGTEKYHDKETPPLPTAEDSETDKRGLREKIVHGYNAEVKRVTMRGADDYRRITGIPARELIGSSEAPYRVLFVGEPFQARLLPDGERFFYMDYEFAETANFRKDYRSIAEEAEWIIEPYSMYAYGLKDFIQEVKRDIDEGLARDEHAFDEHTGPLRSFVETITPAVEQLDDMLEKLRAAEWEVEYHPGAGYQEAFEELERLKTAVSEQTETIRAQLDELTASQNEWIADIRQRIKEWRALFLEKDDMSEEEFQELGPRFEKIDILMHVNDLLSRSHRLVNAITQGYQDVSDYTSIVQPKLQAFQESLSYEKIAELYDRYPNKTPEEFIREHERQIIDELRLEKQPKDAHVIQAVFPELPFAEGSIDRIIASYSISTHQIKEMTPKDFDAWAQTLARVLSHGGKAYIFPVQQGFPYGRKYNRDALEEALRKCDLEYEFSGNWYDSRSGDTEFYNETLIVTKPQQKEKRA